MNIKKNCDQYLISQASISIKRKKEQCKYESSIRLLDELIFGHILDGLMCIAAVICRFIGNVADLYRKRKKTNRDHHIHCVYGDIIFVRPSIIFI